MNNSSQAIQWGILGCGQIAMDKSVPGLLHANGARLHAIADPLEPRREMALDLAQAAGLPRVRAYDDFAQLLDDPDVDAVYISLPTGMHTTAVVAAATAKKAILCEKPLGNNAREVRQMVLAARDNGVPLMTAYMSRFSDVFQEACRRLRDHAIGQVTFVNAHFCYPAMESYPPGMPGGWRWTDSEGGGPLLDIGVYLAFGLREMLGDPIAQVAPLNCNTMAPPEARVKDTTVATFLTQGGIPGTFVASFSHFLWGEVQFHGTKGRLTVRNVFNQKPGGQLELVTKEGTHVMDSTQDGTLPHFDNYRREFEHFSQALLTGNPYHPTPEEVLADALLLDALKGNVNALAVPTPEQFLSL